MKVRHNCGICVASTLHDVYSFIKALQHRGREACGIAAIGDTIDVVKWKGKVDHFDLTDLHKILPGNKYHTYFAHVRYATKGREDKILEDAHPHVLGGVEENKGDHVIITNADMVIVHNGQVNFDDLCGGCDTKRLLEYYKDKGEKTLLREIPGSFSFAIADKNKKEVVVLRDRFGMRPCCLGFKDGKYVFASEDIALRKCGAVIIEDLEPGFVYYLCSRGTYRKEKVIESPKRHCFFEWNYISDQDSILDSVSVKVLRENIGRELAKEFNLEEVDIITYLPRCPETSARAYANALGKEGKFVPVFYKMRGERSFQGTNHDQRVASIKSNLHILPEAVEMVKDKVVLCIDDSIIRGTNSARAKKLLENCSAKKIIFLSYTPKIGVIGEDFSPRGCLFGVDMPPEDNFIVKKDGQNRTEQEINEIIGAEVKFLSLQGLANAFHNSGIDLDKLCTYCIGGNLPFE